jgi:nucleoside 2-deoxyribosyltransferase
MTAKALESSSMKIFLAAPFTQLLEPDGAGIGRFRAIIREVMTIIEEAGHSVVCAHEREEWGLRLDTPARALKLDLTEIEISDVLLAIVGSPPSPGVQLEIGFAIAKQRKMVVCVKLGDFVPYLLRGIDSLPSVVLLEYSQETDLLAKLRDYFSSINASKINT